MKLITKFINKNFKVIISVLIVLIVSFFSIGFTLSKLLSSSSKTGSLSIAKYSLDQVGEINLGMISPGDTIRYEFEISNKDTSDGKIAGVAQDYNIKVITTNNLPLTYVLSGTNTTNKGKLAGDLDETTLTTLTKGNLPHTDYTVHSYILDITWPSDKTESKYLNEVDQVSLSVEAVQKN